MAYQTQPRKRPNQAYARGRFNMRTNSTKRINKTLNKRGGIKL